MTKVVGVSFKKGGRQYFFSSNKLKLKINDEVIVETEKGQQYGYVEKEEFDLENSGYTNNLKQVIRIVTKKDIDQNEKNKEDAKDCLVKCRKLVEKEKLKMYIVEANYSFDRDQIVFKFLSDTRIDFRNLVKELAKICKTRVELRQIGVRDKAKEIGGLGPCGRELCCCKFLKDFDTVSINMAKNQNIALNPSKINGVCGRLLCCLKYEDEFYKEVKKTLPKYGDIVKVRKTSGKVVKIDVVKETYTIETKDKEFLEIKLDEKRN